MTKKEIIEKLDELKDAVWSENKDNTISEVKNIIYDFMNDTQDFVLEYILDRFTNIDSMESYINMRLKQFGLSQVSRDLQSVDSDDDYYKIDDVDGEVTVIDSEEVEEWIDEIIDELRKSDVK